MEKKNLKIDNTNPKKIAILSYEKFSNKLLKIAKSLRNDLIISKIHSEQELNNLLLNQDYDLLISFGSSIIVSKKILEIKGLKSVNIHAASPKYPGRDPHHFAVYDNVKKYGATMHFMINKVDEGGIIDVDFFSVKPSVKPNELLIKANDSGLKLFIKLLKNFDKKNYLKVNNKYKWSNKKNTRKDFEKLCNLSFDIDNKEFMKRLNACSFPGYNNLFLNIYGKKFQIITNE